jgi:hypothetical protein
MPYTPAGFVPGSPTSVSSTLGSSSNAFALTLGNFVIVSSYDGGTLAVIDVRTATVVNTYVTSTLVGVDKPTGMCRRPGTPGNFLLAFYTAGAVWELKLSTVGVVTAVARRIQTTDPLLSVADSGSLVCTTAFGGIVACYDTGFGLLRWFTVPTTLGSAPVGSMFTRDGLALVLVQNNYAASPSGLQVFSVADILSSASPAPAATFSSATYALIANPWDVEEYSGGWLVTSATAPGRVVQFPISAPYTTGPPASSVVTLLTAAAGISFGSLGFSVGGRLVVAQPLDSTQLTVFNYVSSTVCQPGYVLSASQVGTCVPCAAGTAMATINAASACTACPTGTSSFIAAASCNVVSATTAVVRVGRAPPKLPPPP